MGTSVPRTDLRQQLEVRQVDWFHGSERYPYTASGHSLDRDDCCACWEAVDAIWPLIESALAAARQETARAIAQAIENVPRLTPADTASFIDVDLPFPPKGLHASYFTECGYNMGRERFAALARETTANDLGGAADD